MNTSTATIDEKYQQARKQFKKGDYLKALANYKQILKENPVHRRTLNDAVEAAFCSGKRKEAQHYADRLRQEFSDDYILLNRLGVILYRYQDYANAIDCYLDINERLGEKAPVYNNLGLVYNRLGLSEKAADVYRRALELDPNHHMAHSNLNYLMHNYGEPDPQELFLAHENWAKRHLGHISDSFNATHVDVNSNRRLRIGYMSGDMRQHAVSRFIWPILAHHDQRQHEIHVFDTKTHIDDKVTHRLKELTPHWHQVGRLDDDALVKKVRSLKIDILVDLSGHTSGGRMPVFAHRSAPVQLTYLGYPDTSGLKAMDYRFTDGICDPVGERDRQHSETLVRLSPAMHCYTPWEDAPPVSPSPQTENGFITFGCFNNFTKVQPEMLATWAEILARVPTSRLLLKSRPLWNESVRERVLSTFSNRSIDPNRIILVGNSGTLQEHFGRFNDADIALDTYPYNGTTTTCDALWMGLPVITRSGRVHAARVSASLLSAVGLDTLATSSEADYIETAIALAADPARVATLRSGMRDRMRQSILLDGETFTRNLEGHYRDLWRTWCVNHTTEYKAPRHHDIALQSAAFTG